MDEQQPQQPQPPMEQKPKRSSAGIVLGAIVIVIIVVLGILYLTGVIPKIGQSNQGSKEITGISFEELWNRIIDWPEEYAIKWTFDSITGSSVNEEEFKKGNNWMYHSYNEDYSQDESYAFLLEGKTYTCNAWGGLSCGRTTHNDPEEYTLSESTNEKERRANQLLESYYSLPIHLLDLSVNPRNIGMLIFDDLRRIVEKGKGIDVCKFKETVDTMQISKINYGDIDCYFFELTSKETEGLAELVDEYEEMMESESESLSEEEKEEIEWMIESIRYETENPVSKVKLCFNQYNILTYEYIGDNPPDTINELDYFSPTVEDDSVFELPLTVGPVREDIVAEGDASQCQLIEDINDRELCIIELAVQNNDPTICNQIPEANYFYTLCFDAFVRKGQGRLVPCKEKQNCGGISSDICAIPQVCLDEACENTLEPDSLAYGFACYKICSDEIECPYPGADSLIKPVCGNYEIGETGNYDICI